MEQAERVRHSNGANGNWAGLSEGRESVCPALGREPSGAMSRAVGRKEAVLDSPLL